MSALMAHTKFEILQAIRIPMVYVAMMFMPAVGMVLFVMPVVGNDPAGATFGTASMCLFTVLIICSAQYSVGIADARLKPWGGYVRTLPGGPLPKMGSMILLSIVLVLAGSLPLVGLAAVGTAASVSFGGLVLGMGALALGVLPFALLMLTIGYAVNPYLVSVVSSVAPLILAYLGGYFTNPGDEGGFIATIAPFFPTRGPAEVVWAAVGDYSPNPVSLVMFVVWTVVFGLLAYRAYRGDEGKRFR
jgi:ABC-2 type transport system permease protein